MNGAYITWSFALRFGIFGSCVTRDAFELSGESKTGQVIAAYVARTTINSALSNALPIDELLPSFKWQSFEERCVAVDLLKLQFDSLGKDRFDYLIVDLIDERHSILMSGDACLTYSMPFVRVAKEHAFNTTKLEHRSSLDPRVVETTLGNIPRFIQRLSEIVPADRIILHEAYWAEHFLDAENNVSEFPNAELARAINKILLAYHTKIASECRGIRWIRPSAEHRFGDARHRWSLAPFHYTVPYYRDFMHQLGELVAADKEQCVSSAA